MDVLPRLEGGDEPRVVGQVGDAAQLDLVVVGDQQHSAPGGHEHLTEGAAGLGAHRDVVQVGRIRGEPTGAGHRLVEGGMDAAGASVHFGRQPMPVGGAQLLHLPEGQQVLHDVVLAAQALQRGGVGGVAGRGPLLGRQAEALEEHPGELLGGVDVELLPGVGHDRGAQPRGLLLELAG